MSEICPEGGKTRPGEVAAYIAAMTLEMGRLARKHNLLELGYLLDLARMEAEGRAITGSGEDRKRIA